MRRRRRNQPPTPSIADETAADAPEPTDPALDEALRAAAHRFLGLTDQAENELDEEPRPAVAAESAVPAMPEGEPEPAPSTPPSAERKSAVRPARRRPQLRGRRRVGAAALVVAAVAVPGSGMLDGVTGLVQGDGGGPESELALGTGGYLPILEDAPSVDIFQEPEQLEAVPVSEAPEAGPVQDVLSSTEVVEELGEGGIPEVALQAYNRAADRLGEDAPSCGIRWSLLAAIGRVESNHGRFGGAQLRSDGYGTRRILGIPLDGRPNVALIRDTDRGELDGDTTFDRAVGPMQFIPTTWRSVGVDANRDGRRDPNNMFDATEGAAGYLCGSGGDLRTIEDQAQAVRRYNNAYSYVQLVLRLARMYETGRVTPLPTLPDLPPPPPLPQPQPTPTPSPAPPTTTTAPPTTTTTTTTTVPPSTTTTTAPPTTTTTVPPSTTTTVPPSTTTTTTTTVPPAPDPETPPAAVGWAPAMREVVLDILDDAQPPCPPPPATAVPAPPPAAECPSSPTTTVPATVPTT